MSPARPKLTPWFPPEVLPVHEGVYQTKGVDERAPKNPGYSFFDATDRIWGCSDRDPKAAQAAPDFEFAHQQKAWRGLAQEPKP